MRSNAIRLLKIGVIQCAAAGAILGGTEATLRFGGRPSGAFAGWFQGPLGLYPQNTELTMPGAISWRIKTNAWGFRGGNLSLEKPAGVTRVAMVGDSVTDGFLVGEENTYPAQTERALAEKGVSVEVINAAHGGATIDKELAILRDAVARFTPDIVVLTFVTNDLSALEQVDDAHLLTQTLSGPSLKRRALRSLAVDTAVGEWLFDRYLRQRSPAYQSPLAVPRADLPKARDTQTSGRDFAANAREFLKRFETSDTPILGHDLPSEMTRQLQRYFTAWDVFVRFSRDHGMQPVFVYFPAYSQIYDPAAPMTIRDLLRQHCAEKGVLFFDLTPSLRAQGDTVLHLAPLDYHLIAAGNRVTGQALADFLVSEGLARANRE